MTRKGTYGPITAIITGMLVAVAIICSGCKTIKPVVAPEVHARTNDSIRKEYVHDSIYIDRWHTVTIKGDTVIIHDSIDRWREKLVFIHDSIDNSRIDTIPQIVEIEKPQSMFLRNSGIALWVIIALIVAGIIVGIVIKFAK